MQPVNMLADGTVIERTDACLGVRFFELAEEHPSKLRDDGFPEIVVQEMIEVIIPGCRDILHRKVNDLDKVRFKSHYENYKKNKREAIDGTPLIQFPFISASERKELEYFNIYTAEQLIHIPDGNIEKLGVDGRDLIKKVKNYMNYAKDTSVVGQLTQENENLKREMEIIKAQMNQILQIKSEDKEDGKIRKFKRKQNAE